MSSFTESNVATLEERKAAAGDIVGVAEAARENVTPRDRWRGCLGLSLFVGDTAVIFEERGEPTERDPDGRFLSYLVPSDQSAWLAVVDPAFRVRATLATEEGLRPAEPCVGCLSAELRHDDAGMPYIGIGGTEQSILFGQLLSDMTETRQGAIAHYLSAAMTVRACHYRKDWGHADPELGRELQVGGVLYRECPYFDERWFPRAWMPLAGDPDQATVELANIIAELNWGEIPSGVLRRAGRALDAEMFAGQASRRVQRSGRPFNYVLHTHGAEAVRTAVHLEVQRMVRPLGNQIHVPVTWARFLSPGSPLLDFDESTPFFWEIPKSNGALYYQPGLDAFVFPPLRLTGPKALLMGLGIDRVTLNAGFEPCLNPEEVTWPAQAVRL